MIYLELLPDEIYQRIYKEVFKEVVDNINSLSIMVFKKNKQKEYFYLYQYKKSLELNPYWYMNTDFNYCHLVIDKNGTYIKILNIEI
jgi:hypothetical protein